MDRYLRAYRDPKSPLTPLTPLSRSNVFDFNLGGGDNSLQDTLRDTLSQVVNSLSPVFAAATAGNEAKQQQQQQQESNRCPNRYSAGFCRLRNIFEKSCSLGVVDKLRRTTSHRGKVATPKLVCRTPVGNTEKCAYGQPTKTIKTEKGEKSKRPIKTEKEEEETTPIYSSATKLDLPALASNLLSAVDIFLQPPTPLAKGKKFKSSSEFRQCSPVAPQPLSPRIADLLTKSGMSRYAPLFQREEIDMEVFRLLTERELKMLGVFEADDRQRLLAAITMAFERY